MLTNTYYYESKARNEKKKKKKKKKKPNLQHLNTSLSLTTRSISEAEYATNFGFVQWEKMQMEMDHNSKNHICMKKRKSKGKSKQNREDLTEDGSSESSAVVVVIPLGSSELHGGWRPEMEEPVAVVAGGRRCSAGGWL
jgi:hypothetical protein